mgnify:CR=1 FL=1
MKQEMIIHQDRNMRITRLLAKRGNECKYKIEVTTGRATQSYEKYCASDGEAFKICWLKLKELQRKEP